MNPYKTPRLLKEDIRAIRLIWYFYTYTFYIIFFIIILCINGGISLYVIDCLLTAKLEQNISHQLCNFYHMRLLWEFALSSVLIAILLLIKMYRIEMKSLRYKYNTKPKHN